MLRYLAQPLVLAGVVVALLLGVLLHNLAQAFVAKLLGDPTPRLAGFLQVNLRRHFFGWGLVPMAFATFGWGFAAPVRMRERYWVRPWRIAAALAVGPVVYLLLCLAALAGAHAAGVAGSANGSTTLVAAAYTLAGLCVFSMLPIPPLDAGRILLTLAPPSRGWQQARYQLEDRNIGVVIAIAIVLLPLALPGLPSVLDQLVGPLVRALAPLVGYRL